MKRHYTIKKTKEIDAIFKLKKSKANQYFTIVYQEIDQPHFKYALSIGRKYGNAVMRNLMKRRLRAIVQINKDMIRNTMQFIIVVKPSSKDLEFQEIKKHVEDLFNRATIMEKKE
jgi:ribonuclease P protein component